MLEVHIMIHLVVSGLYHYHIKNDVVRVYRGAVGQDTTVPLPYIDAPHIEANVHELNSHIFNAICTIAQEIPVFNVPQSPYIRFISDGATLIHDEPYNPPSNTTKRIRYKRNRMTEHNKGKGLMLNHRDVRTFT